jgi:hypothetical protein
MTITVYPQATIRAYGDIHVERDQYAPLQQVDVKITGRGKGDESCMLRVEDAAGDMYFEADVPLKNNHGSISFHAAGKLGTHWIYLRFPGDEDQTAATAWGPGGVNPVGEKGCPYYYAPNFGKSEDARDVDKHVRYANFILEASTVVRTGDTSFDTLYDITRGRMRLNRRVFNFQDGPMVYYCSADTWETSVAWLRDWVYQMPATRFWEREMINGLDHFARGFQRDGRMPDRIDRHGATYRQPVESDAEYVAVFAVWLAWRTIGDDAWAAEKLPILEEALEQLHLDPIRWDAEHQLVARAHTCDTWDFEIGGMDEYVDGRRVIATCDQGSYYRALRMMAEMYAATGRPDQAAEYERAAEAYRDRANALLFDGVKYQHHIHLTPIEHPGFDETQQLAAGNTWAMEYGLATHEQAVSIIDEYKRRHEQTGDKYPWWSLQPGYPDELNYWPNCPHCAQGAYANGGLLPYVGAELTRSCFRHGREAYGVELLQQYLDMLAHDDNRVYVWYWRNGEPGIRTANEVPRAGWGMAEWLLALLEGVGGFCDAAAKMHRVALSPRWAATDRSEAHVCVRYDVNEAYVAYRMSIDHEAHTITLEHTGSGSHVDWHVLLPGGWRARHVIVEDGAVKFCIGEIESSVYVDFQDEIRGHRRVTIECDAIQDVSQ